MKTIRNDHPEYCEDEVHEEAVVMLDDCLNAMRFLDAEPVIVESL